MRPPPLPSRRGAPASASSYSGSQSPIATTSSQLTGLRQTTREAPDRVSIDDSYRGNPSLDRSGDSSYAAYAQSIQHQRRSWTLHHRDTRAFPYDSPHLDARGSHPSTSAGSSSEGVPLHELKTSPSAPPPMMTGLPQHSTEHR